MAERIQITQIGGKNINIPVNSHIRQIRTPVPTQHMVGFADHRPIGMGHGKGLEGLLAGVILDVIVNIGKIDADLIFLCQNRIVQQNALAGMHIK